MSLSRCPCLDVRGVASPFSHRQDPRYSCHLPGLCTGAYAKDCLPYSRDSLLSLLCYISLWLYILFRIKSLINFLPPKFFRRSSVTCSWEALWASDKMAALMHCTADMIFLGWLIPLLLCLRQKACGEFMTLVLVICSSLHERPIKTSCKSDLTSHHWSQQEDYGHIFYRLEWKSGSAWIHRSPKLLFEETVQKRFTWTRKRCRTIEVEEIWVKASPQ